MEKICQGFIVTGIVVKREKQLSFLLKGVFWGIMGTEVCAWNRRFEIKIVNLTVGDGW